MRRTALLAAGILAFGLDAAAIEIGEFDVSVLLDPDGTIFVTETIGVDFGELEKHGIFRTIPVSYARTETVAGVPVGTRYAIRMRSWASPTVRGSPFLSPPGPKIGASSSASETPTARSRGSSPTSSPIEYSAPSIISRPTTSSTGT